MDTRRGDPPHPPPSSSPPAPVNDLQVLHRVHPVFYVRHVHVLERARDVEHAVDGRDVGQKRVAQPFPVGRPLDQARDVDNLQERGHLRFGLVQVDKPLEAVVRDVDARRVGLDRAEREVLGGDAHAGEHVEEGRLADVGEADDADLRRGGEGGVGARGVRRLRRPPGAASRACIAHRVRGSAR